MACHSGMTRYKLFQGEGHSRLFSQTGIPKKHHPAATTSDSICGKPPRFFSISSSLML